MKRREFSLAAGTALAASAFTGREAFAQGNGTPQRGVDYLPLEKPVATESPPGKVEVIEFFWYSCPHCNAFEPMLQDWLRKLPPEIAFRRIPVSFRDDFIPQQKLYYTLEAMGKLPELHTKVFHAIHVEHRNIAKQDDIANWVATQGVDKAKFLELFNSFTIVSKARKGTQTQDAYKVQGVPALGIAGRFYTDGTMTGSMPRALQVVEYLSGEVAKGR